MSTPIIYEGYVVNVSFLWRVIRVSTKWLEVLHANSNKLPVGACENNLGVCCNTNMQHENDCKHTC